METTDPLVTIKVRKSTRRLLNMLAATHEVTVTNVVRWLACSDDADAIVENGSWGANSMDVAMKEAAVMDKQPAVTRGRRSRGTK